MDIEFRNVSGSRVGLITGNDIKDSNGNRVGMIVGNDIKDSYGNRVGMLNGSDIKDSNGNRVGMIIGNDIKDTYGNRVGYPISGASQLEMAAAGLILFRLKPEAASAGNPVRTPSSSDKNSSQHEGSAVNRSSSVSSGSIVNSLSQTMGQTLFANIDGDQLLEISKGYIETFRKAEEEERERKIKKWQEEEAREKAEKEAWEKKKIYVFGLGGLICGLAFTFLPGLAADNEILTIIIKVLIGLTSAFLLMLLTDFSIFFIAIIGGVIVFSILKNTNLGFLFNILPFKVFYFPIGFIFGFLFILLLRKKESLKFYPPKKEKLERLEQKARKKTENARLESEGEKKKRKKIQKITIITIIAVIGIPAGFLAYNSQQNSVTIPGGAAVIKEGEYARKQLVNVEIPDSVTSIGDNAFKRNKLTGIVIPDSVISIGANAFSGNKITSITIGPKVIISGDAFDSGFDAFYNNNNMEAGTYKWIAKNNSGWTQTNGDSIIVPGSTLAEKLDWLQRGADSNNTYNIIVNANENIMPQTLEYQDILNITIVLKGDGANRVITLLSNGSMFKIRPNVNLVLDNNITLKGRYDNDNAIITVDGGTFKMNAGSNITGNQVIAGSTGGVNVSSGTFEMLGGTISNNSTTFWWGGGVQVGGGNFIMIGGTISRNTASYGGGVQIHHNGKRGGKFTMKGGTIIGNTARESGGGVYVNGDVGGSVGGTFIMEDGTITGNTANKYGGGVFIHNNQSDVPTAFTKTGGTITGYNSAPSTGNVVRNNTGVLSRRGHAVSFSGGNVLRRKDTTAGLGINFFLGKDNFSGAWEQ